MPSSHTAEMRERVIARVESGASRREAAEHFEISLSAAVKWLQRWHDDGSATARPGRKHHAIGEACDAQATDCRQPHRAVTVFRSTRVHV
jgi:transposase